MCCVLVDAKASAHSATTKAKAFRNLTQVSPARPLPPRRTNGRADKCTRDLAEGEPARVASNFKLPRHFTDSSSGKSPPRTGWQAPARCLLWCLVSGRVSRLQLILQSHMGLLTERAFPELAAALRQQASEVIARWEELVRQEVEPARRLSSAALRHHQPEILERIADALGEGGEGQVERLQSAGPEQGISRFSLNYQVADVLTEDRLLRQALLERVCDGLSGPLSQIENIALNAAVDVVMQHGTLAFLERQRQQLRAAAEAELMFLSFLSHDLSNHLQAIDAWLELLRHRLGALSDTDAETEAVDQVRQSIAATITGMRQLLLHERLRHRGAQPALTRLRLRPLAMSITHLLNLTASAKGLRLVVDVPADAVVTTDPDILAIILRNLIDNAVKFSARGEVGVRATQRRTGDGREYQIILSVSDEGPGIPPEHLDRMFEAFERGAIMGGDGQRGVGLGLAIAARAARLLGANLSVESQLTVGSTFYLRLPPSPAAGEDMAGSRR